MNVNTFKIKLVKSCVCTGRCAVTSNRKCAKENKNTVNRAKENRQESKTCC